jgi:hypothetical protein
MKKEGKQDHNKKTPPGKLLDGTSEAPGAERRAAGEL